MYRVHVIISDFADYIILIQTKKSQKQLLRLLQFTQSLHMV